MKLQPSIQDLASAEIGQIYDASMVPDGGRVCLELLCRATGSVGAIYRNLDEPHQVVTTPSLREANLAYLSQWWRFDVLPAASRKRSSEASVLMDTDFAGETDRASHPYFEGYLREHGLGAFAAYFPAPLFDARFVLVAHRAAAAGPFGMGDKAAMARLAPHVSRALVLASQVSAARSRDAALLAMLDRLTYGALLVDRGAKVVAMNEVARALLDDGLALLDGTIVETFGTPRGTIERVIRAALGEEAGATKSAIVHRPSGRKPIVLQAMGLSQAPMPLRQDLVLLMLLDTGMSPAMAHVSLVQTFGLTLAEAKVAALVGSGLSPAEAAEQLGSAPGTVRVQLKNVFNKLDIKRQSELVRLMAKLEVLCT